MFKTRDQKSLSLIEVVIAVVLLGALLGSVMSLFSQGFTYSAKYKRKLAVWGLLGSTMENNCSLSANRVNGTWTDQVNNFNYSLTFNVSNDTADYTNGTGNYSFNDGDLYACNATVSWCEGSADLSCGANNTTSFFLNTKIAKY